MILCFFWCVGEVYVVCFFLMDCVLMKVVVYI